MCKNRVMQHIKDKKKASSVVKLKDETYRRLKDYLDSRELPPSLTAVVSLAVDKWLDEREKKV